MTKSLIIISRAEKRREIGKAERGFPETVSARKIYLYLHIHDSSLVKYLVMCVRIKMTKKRPKDVECTLIFVLFIVIRICLAFWFLDCINSLLNIPSHIYSVGDNTHAPTTWSSTK